MLTPLWLTLKVALLATLLAGVAGIGLGWWMAQRRFPGHALADAVLMLPMVLPPTVLGYYLIVVVGRNGVLGRYLDQWFGINLMFTWQGAVIAASIVSLPLIYKAARAAFEDADPRMALAARTLGAGELEIFLRISLPLAGRGVAAGLMLAFARAMGEFGAVAVVSGKIRGLTATMPITIEMLYNEYASVAAFSLAAVLALLALVTLALKTALEWRFAAQLAATHRH